MNLHAVRMLASSGAGLLDGSVLGPLEGYQASSALAFGMALTILAEQLDGAVASLTQENTALRALFGMAAPRVEDARLAERLRVAAASDDDDLRVSALDSANDDLRALLIELHVCVEALGEQGQDLDAAIWSELVRSTERRHVALAPF